MKEIRFLLFIIILVCVNPIMSSQYVETPFFDFKSVQNLSETENNSLGELNFRLIIKDRNLHVKVSSFENPTEPHIIYYKDNKNIIIRYAPLPILDCRASMSKFYDLEFDIPEVNPGIYNIFIDSFSELLQIHDHNFHQYDVNLTEDKCIDLRPFPLTPGNLLNEDLLWIYCHKSKPIATEYLSYERIVLENDNKARVIYSQSKDFEQGLEIGILQKDGNRLWSSLSIDYLPDNYWQWGIINNDIKSINTQDKYLIFEYSNDHIKYFRDYGRGTFIPFYLISESSVTPDENIGVLISTEYENHIQWIDGVGYTGKIATSLVCPSKIMATNTEDYRQILAVKDIKSHEYRYINPERALEFESYSSSDIIQYSKKNRIKVEHHQIIIDCDVPGLVKISDINGKTVFTKECTNSLVINTSQFTKGIYIIALDDIYCTTCKFIVN